MTSIEKKLHDIKAKVGTNHLMRLCFNKGREFIMLSKYYVRGGAPEYRGVVFCVDGHVQSGGLF